MSDQNMCAKFTKQFAGRPTGKTNCCGMMPPQDSQETANQDKAETPADRSSCCDTQGLQESGGCDCKEGCERTKEDGE